MAGFRLITMARTGRTQTAFFPPQTTAVLVDLVDRQNRPSRDNSRSASSPHRRITKQARATGLRRRSAGPVSGAKGRTASACRPSRRWRAAAPRSETAYRRRQP